MRKAIVWLILISMICVSISGAAFSLNKNFNQNDNNHDVTLATESAEVNEILLDDIKENVNEYLNIEKYNDLKSPRTTVKEIELPWTDRPKPSGAGDFVDWIINVNYKDKYFQEEISISPIDFVRRFLDNPWYFETVIFDVDENGEDDLRVSYSIFVSRIVNYQENIDEKSLRSILRVDTTEIMDRTAKLEVWSELSVNIGLLKLSKSKDVAKDYNTNAKSPIINLLQRLRVGFEKLRFSNLKNIIDFVLKRLNNKVTENEKPSVEVAASSDDWISMGIGVGSKEGVNIPLYFEKRFNIGKKNILSPTVYEHEICQVNSKDPLALLFGFKSFKGGSNKAIIDAAFSVEFDPAIYLRTQYIPLKGYIYYNYDTGSANNAETNVTFTGRLNEAIEESVELTLIFDSTTEIASANNWMSFDVDLLGFDYKANRKFDIGVLVTSPLFSAKAKLVGIPSSVSYFFDSDLSVEFQQGHLFDVEASGSLNLQMNSKLDDIILYYPKLGSNEPDIEFIKISDIPSINAFTVYSHLNILNESMLTLLGEGYVDFSMSSDLSEIKVYYFKANPNDPDKLFIDVPGGIPQSQRVGGKLKLYIDLNNLLNKNNYIFGRAYRTASSSINEISVYLPGDLSPEPIVRVTDIPSNADIEAKFIWAKLKGYALAERYDSASSDPFEFNLEFGTFKIYNKLSIGNGRIEVGGHLADPGYFYFDTENEMIGEEFRLSDTSTGNQFDISTANVKANDLMVEWDADFNQSPIPIDELAIQGDVSLLKDFEVDISIQGKYMDFEGDWEIGEKGEFSLDFNQNQPIEIIIDDFLPNNPNFDIAGGIIINQDFHFDIKWNWKQGVSLDDPGYFLINEDTNEKNIDWIFLNVTYIPDGYQTPQYGVEIGANDVLIVFYLKWWKGQSMIFPKTWLYYVITGTFYLDLLWNGHWDNIITIQT